MVFTSGNVLTACLAALSLFQSSPTVTLDVPATSLAAIAKKVAEQSGLQISVDRQVAETPLIVYVKDVPANDLLSRLAKAAGAEVVKDGDALRLARTSAMLRELREERQTLLEKFWKDSIEERRAALTKAPWDASSAKKYVLQWRKHIQSGGEVPAAVSIRQVKPAARLLFRLVSLIGYKELASCPEAGAVIYSRFPTRMQRAMPHQIEALVKQYVQESLANPPITEEDDGVDLRTPEGELGKIHLEIDTQTPRGDARLRIYDARGRFVDEAGFDANAPSEVDEKVVAGLKPMKLSPLAIEELRFAADFEGWNLPDGLSVPRQGDAASAALVARIMEPEKQDPIGLAASEVLREVAVQRSLNLVASIPDDSGSSYMLEFDDLSLDPATYIRALDKWGIHLKVDSGWAMVGPKCRLEQEDYRLPRSSLGAFVRSVSKQGPTLEAEINLMSAVSVALTESDIAQSSSAFGYLAHLGTGSPLAGNNSPHMLRFLGKLSPIHRSELARTGSLQFGNLTPSERQALVDATNVEGALDLEQVGTFDYLKEGTEVLPDGVPLSTQIHLKSSARAGFTFQGEQFLPRRYAVAKVISTREKLMAEDGVKEFVDVMLTDRVWPVTIESYELVIVYTPTVKAHEAYSYYRRRGDGKFFDPMSNAMLKAEIDKSVKELEKLSDMDLMGELWKEDR